MTEIEVGRRVKEGRAKRRPGGRQMGGEEAGEIGKEMVVLSSC
jgi:hypothetical protein